MAGAKIRDNYNTLVNFSYTIHFSLSLRPPVKTATGSIGTKPSGVAHSCKSARLEFIDSEKQAAWSKNTYILVRDYPIELTNIFFDRHVIAERTIRFGFEHFAHVSALDKAWNVAGSLLQASLGGNALSGFTPYGDVRYHTQPVLVLDVTVSYCEFSR